MIFMLKYFLLLYSLVLSQASFAQKKEFEGSITYRNEVRSKVPELTDQLLKKLMAGGDSTTVFVKNGNFLWQTSLKTVYYRKDEEKVFTRYKGIDTLFYTAYEDDTSSTPDINLTAREHNIIGFTCKEIRLSFPDQTTTYRYAEELYTNPEHTRNLKHRHYNLYAGQTKSIWLSNEQDHKMAWMLHQATSIYEQTIPDSFFKLPQLPIVKEIFSIKRLLILPQFALAEGWQQYLRANLKTSLTNKYLKLQKGQERTEQTILVSFLVTENGQVAEIEVKNKDSVHPKLAGEAIRVIANSNWRPATVLGDPIKYRIMQPVSFVLTRD